MFVCNATPLLIWRIFVYQGPPKATKGAVLASELRLRMSLTGEETWKKQTFLTSAVKLPTYFGSMFFLLTFWTVLTLIQLATSHKQKINITNLQKIQETKIHATRCFLRFTSGIICGSGSFAVQFGDHLRSGDHLRRCTFQSFRALTCQILTAPPKMRRSSGLEFCHLTVLPTGCFFHCQIWLDGFKIVAAWRGPNFKMRSLPSPNGWNCVSFVWWTV